MGKESLADSKGSPRAIPVLDYAQMESYRSNHLLLASLACGAITLSLFVVYGFDFDRGGDRLDPVEGSRLVQSLWLAVPMCGIGLYVISTRAARRQGFRIGFAGLVALGLNGTGLLFATLGWAFAIAHARGWMA